MTYLLKNGRERVALYLMKTIRTSCHQPLTKQPQNQPKTLRQTKIRRFIPILPDLIPKGRVLVGKQWYCQADQGNSGDLNTWTYHSSYNCVTYYWEMMILICKRERERERERGDAEKFTILFIYLHVPSFHLVIKLSPCLLS